MFQYVSFESKLSHRLYNLNRIHKFIKVKLILSEKEDSCHIQNGILAKDKQLSGALNIEKQTQSCITLENTYSSSSMLNIKEVNKNRITW